MPCLFNRIILHYTVCFVVNFSSFLFRYGCPSMEELDSYNQEFKKRLDEVGALGEIPDDLGLEVMFCADIVYFYSSRFLYNSK